MARRRGPPGLTLSAMKGGASEDGSDSSAAGVMRLPTDNGAIGGAGSPGATRDTGGTPFSNFRKIVYVFLFHSLLSARVTVSCHLGGTLHCAAPRDGSVTERRSKTHFD